jgi:hypothetical protein
MLSVCKFPYQLLNGYINLYEILYVYRGIWTNLNGTLHKLVPPLYEYV